MSNDPKKSILPFINPSNGEPFKFTPFNKHETNAYRKKLAAKIQAFKLEEWPDETVFQEPSDTFIAQSLKTPYNTIFNKPDNQ